MRVHRPATAPSDDDSVTTLELFFDLVFVFAITQLTAVIIDGDGLEGYLEALNIGGTSFLIVAASLCLPAAAFGIGVSGLAELIALVAVTVAMLLARVASPPRPTRRRGPPAPVERSV